MNLVPLTYLLKKYNNIENFGLQFNNELSLNVSATGLPTCQCGSTNAVIIPKSNHLSVMYNKKEIKPTRATGTNVMSANQDVGTLMNSDCGR
jgi:hypothetical protein